jgi:hypothetical protein
VLAVAPVRTGTAAVYCGAITADWMVVAGMSVDGIAGKVAAIAADPQPRQSTDQLQICT